MFPTSKFLTLVANTSLLCKNTLITHGTNVYKYQNMSNISKYVHVCWSNIADRIEHKWLFRKLVPLKFWSKLGVNVCLHVTHFDGMGTTVWSYQGIQICACLQSNRSGMTADMVIQYASTMPYINSKSDLDLVNKLTPSCYMTHSLTIWNGGVHLQKKLTWCYYNIVISQT